MKWEKKGLIFKTKGDKLWNQSHAQVPTTLHINDEVVRIYYCTRDKNNRSLTTFIDVNASNPKEIIYQHDKPILELGERGCFDDSGVMPTWLEKIGSKIYFYYIGWNVGITARYRVAHGLAISEDNGLTFKRFSKGPMMDRSTIDPISVSNHCVLRENEIWKMWYMSYTKWVQHENIVEPYYIIKYAESKDGLIWYPKNIVCIDVQNEMEGGIARPYVLKEDGLYKMWSSYRKRKDYRKDLDSSYRIGYAESQDGLNWIRKDSEAGIGLSKEEWDSEMIAYPHIYIHDNIKYMLYNGNGFGKSGFGYAKEI